MPYEILYNGQVLKIEGVITDNQTAITKKPFGMEKRITAAATKNTAQVNETVEIAFQWQRFNADAETWVNDQENVEPFMLNASGKTDDLQPVDGAESIVFSSAEPKTHIVKTVNPGVENVRLEVAINA